MSTVVVQKRIGKKGVSYAINYAHPVTGKKIYYKTLQKYKDAQSEAQNLRALLDTGNIPEDKKKRLNPLKFSEVAESLRAEWKSRVIIRDLSEKTYEEYCIWLNVLERTFGEELLCKVPTEDIIDYRNYQVEKNSVISANRYLIIFKFVFAHGLKLNAVLENPAKDIKLISEKEHERKNFLFPHDIEKLLKASQQIRSKYYLPAIILLGAEHGASTQEIIDLKWSNIAFDWNGVGLISFFRSKNKKERTDFLMPRTKEALLRWKEHLLLKQKKKMIIPVQSDYVFCRLNGERIKEFKTAWKSTCRIAEITDFHFHDLRHTFCSNLLLSGASLKDVKEMIGHSDIAMTDRYSHLSLNHKVNLQNQLANHYSNDSLRNTSNQQFGSYLVAGPEKA